jgi:hypothetical protein
MHGSMKPVFQTRFTEDDGNCFEACLASILELDLDDIPEYTEGNKRMQPYFARLDRELLQGHGLRAVAINVGHKTDGDQPDRLPDYVGEDVYRIASIADTEGAGFVHAVVMRGRELAHDPNREDLRKTGTADFADRIACALLLVPLDVRPTSRKP